MLNDILLSGKLKKINKEEKNFSIDIFSNGRLLVLYYDKEELYEILNEKIEKIIHIRGSLSYKESRLCIIVTEIYN